VVDDSSVHLIIPSGYNRGGANHAHSIRRNHIGIIDIFGGDRSGRLCAGQGPVEKDGRHADPLPPELLVRIDGEPNCGQFATAILPLKDVDGDGIPDLAVSAVHADGSPWSMTGKIFIFSGGALAADPTVDAAAAIPGDARDMHLGAFLALIEKGMWLVAGAHSGPTAFLIT
jgi:hypothetical protein